MISHLHDTVLVGSGGHFSDLLPVIPEADLLQARTSNGPYAAMGNSRHGPILGADVSFKGYMCLTTDLTKMLSSLEFRLGKFSSYSKKLSAVKGLKFNLWKLQSIL